MLSFNLMNTSRCFVKNTHIRDFYDRFGCGRFLGFYAVRRVGNNGVEENRGRPRCADRRVTLAILDNI